MRRQIEGDGLWYSCGMHLLGERDVEVACTDDVHAEIGWIDPLDPDGHQIDLFADR